MYRSTVAVKIPQSAGMYNLLRDLRRNHLSDVWYFWEENLQNGPGGVR